MVFNLDSKSLQEDSLINQMKLADKRILFYGDDTWIKLFPEHFVRMDGTTSFFVTDYTEVKISGIKTDSVQSSSNMCKNYLLKIYSQHGNFLNAI